MEDDRVKVFLFGTHELLSPYPGGLTASAAHAALKRSSRDEYAALKGCVGSGDSLVSAAKLTQMFHAHRGQSRGGITLMSTQDDETGVTAWKTETGAGYVPPAPPSPPWARPESPGLPSLFLAALAEVEAAPAPRTAARLVEYARSGGLPKRKDEWSIPDVSRYGGPAPTLLRACWGTAWYVDGRRGDDALRLNHFLRGLSNRRTIDGVYITKIGDEIVVDARLPPSPLGHPSSSSAAGHGGGPLGSGGDDGRFVPAANRPYYVLLAEAPWASGLPGSYDLRLGIDRPSEQGVSSLHSIARACGAKKFQWHSEAENPHYELQPGCERTCDAHGAVVVSWEEYLMLSRWDNDDGHLCPGGRHKVVYRQTIVQREAAPVGSEIGFCEHCRMSIRKKA